MKWLQILASYSSVQCLAQAGSYASGLLIIHVLSKTDYAIYTIAGAMLGALTLLSDAGVSSALTAIGGRIYSDNRKLGTLIGNALACRRRLAVIAGTTCIPLFAWILIQTAIGFQTLALVVGLVMTGWYAQTRYQVYLTVLKLRADIRRIQKLDLWSSALRLGFVATLLGLYPGPVGCLIAAAVTSLMQVWLVTHWVRREIEADSDSTEYQPEITASIKHLLPSILFYLVQGQITILLITIFGKAESIAEVGALSRLAAVFGILTAVVTNIVAPRYARMFDRQMLRRRFLEILSLLLTLTAGLTVTAVTWPAHILVLLGPQYSNLTDVIWLAVAGACVNFATATLWTLNMAKGWTKSSWLQIPTTLATQLVIVNFLDFTQVSGILKFSLISGIPFFFLQLWLLREGLKETDLISVVTVLETGEPAQLMNRTV